MTLHQKVLEATTGLDGWCSPEKRLTLVNLVLAIRPKRIVEIGVWGGQSLFPMAMAAAELAQQTNCIAHVVAVDPWKASESIQGQFGEDAGWWNDQTKHNIIYNRFLVTMRRLNLQFIEVRRMSSNECEPFSSIDIFHLDGNHGIQAYADIQKFGPSIPVGGICVLDDLNWTGGAVGQAAQWLKEHGFLELHHLGTGAVYQRIR